MSQGKLYPERIARLKEAKAAQDLSCQQIVDMVLADGGITSLSTVKNIFAPGAHEKKFKDISLAPIEKALGLASATVTPSLAPATEEFYHSIIRELNQRLKDIEHRLKIKDIAIALLVAIQFLWLCIDVATPGSGWFGSDAGYVWATKLGILLVFCVAFLMVKRKHKQE